MAESSITIVIFSDKIIFDENCQTNFERFSSADTQLLFSTLLLNLLYNFEQRETISDLIVYLSGNDFEQLQHQLLQNNLSNHKIFTYQSENDFNFIFEKIKTSKQSILVYADVMGFGQASVREILKLLNSDENTIVIGTSANQSLCVIGFNHFTNNLQKAILYSERDYPKLLSLLKTEEHFIHTFNGFVRVNDINSFRELYNDLSQKKSIEYCSQEMHEKFTHLFVEYKDLLK